MEPQEIEAIIQRTIERRSGLADNTAERYRDYVADPRLKLAQWPYRRLAELALDTAATLNGGTEAVVRWVQEAINAHGPAKVTVDGWAGPQTWDAMVLVDERWLIGYVVAERVQRHAAMVSERPNALPRLVDWMTRATVWLQQGKAEPARPSEPMPEPGDLVVFSRVRDGVKVYWTGGAAWGRADMHSPDSDDRRSEAREMTRQGAAEMLALWPGLALYEMEAA